MLCRLAVQRVFDGDAGEAQVVLRVAGSAVLGSAGQLGSDEKIFASGQALEDGLRALGVDEATIRKARDTLELEASARRFVSFADSVQIPFEALQKADFDLFD